MSRALVAALIALLAACGGAAGSGSDVPLPDYVDVNADVVRAVEEARAAVEAAPDSAEAWGGLGDRFSAHRFLEEAIVCYERAEELDPEAYLWSYRLGWIRFMNNTGDPLPPLERALEAMGDFYGPAHEAYAQVLMRQGRTDDAIRHFERANELDSQGPHAHTALGRLALQRGELEPAREHLEAALERDPDHGEAHLGLAQVYTALGRVDDARRHADLSRSLPQFADRRDALVSPALPPAGPTARTEYGKLLESRGDPVAAAEHYRIAVESDPHAAVARKRLAMLLVKDGKLDQAIALLEQAEAQGAATSQTRDYLARLLKRR